MTLQLRVRLPSAAQFCALRTQTGWGTLTKTQCQSALGASLCGVTLYDGAQCIGMARVIGDGVLNLYVQDVIIAKDYRGQGYGAALLSALISHLKASYPEDCDIGLMAAKGQAEFYARFGFRARPSANTDAGMLSPLAALTPSQSALGRVKLAP